MQRDSEFQIILLTLLISSFFAPFDEPIGPIFVCLHLSADEL